tara:strand:+ start:8337 stop:9593 length:1257 start_codon:yes stop_codon:yes gene_type:complete
VSRIDASLGSQQREQLLAEVRWYLPGFLGAATVERADVVDAAAGLLGLRPQDLARVLAVHALLSDPVRAFVRALPDGVRRPVVASTRPRVAGRAVTSGIDWSATVRQRATSSPADLVWVTRPARRVFDVPENRALAWLLDAVQTRAEATGLKAKESTSAWGTEIQQSALLVSRFAKISWLEGVDKQWPGDDVYERLRADRLGFYRTKVAPASRYMRRILYAPSAQDVADAICDRYFEPTQDWKLFELAVLLRIAAALDAAAERIGGLTLLDGTRSRFARYRLPGDRTVSLHYQGWPSSSGPSELLDAVAHYGLGSSGYSRPDITIEITDSGVSTQIVLLELKASTSTSYLASGMVQLLSYLRERPLLTARASSGWLVAPGIASPPRDAAGRSLWAVSADDVAAAVVALVQRRPLVDAP